MKRLNLLLLVLVVAESAQIGLMAWRRAHVQPRPDFDFSCHEASVARNARADAEAIALDDAGGWLQLADLYRALGAYSAAEHCYAVADELGPSDPDYVYRLALVLDQMGELDESTRVYERVVAGEGRLVPLAWLRIGSNHLRRGDTPAATEALRRSALPAAKMRLARVYLRSGQPEQARMLLDEVLAQHPALLLAAQLRVRAAEALGDFETARRFEDLAERRRVVDHSAEDPQMYARDQQWSDQVVGTQHVQESYRLEETGDLTGAVVAAQKAMEVLPNVASRNRLAQLLVAGGRADEAVPLIEEAAAEEGWNSSWLGTLAEAYARMGDERQARECLLRATRFFGYGGPLRHQLLSEVHARIQRMHQNAGDEEQSRIHQALAAYERGKHHWSNDELESAQRDFLNSTATWDGDPHAWFYLGETQRLTGDAAAAAASYHRCLEVNPNHGRAVRRLREISQTTNDG